ncbi:MAG: hypothetical protein AB7G93_07855 [Bdellovibrionales bacterium]
MCGRNGLVCFLILGVLGLGLLSCSKEKSKSQHTEVEVLPEKPIVITGPFYIGDEEVAGPWFRFSVSLTNNSDEPVTIVAITLEVTSPGSFSTQPMEVNFTPSEFNETFDDFECTYSSFGTIQPNETKILGIESSITGCKSGAVVMYASGLPKDRTGTNYYRYRVKMTPVGWFGTESEPTDRYTRSVNFYTQ